MSDEFGTRAAGSLNLSVWVYKKPLDLSPPILMLMSLSENSEALKGDPPLVFFLVRDIQEWCRHVYSKGLSVFNTWQMVFELS